MIKIKESNNIITIKGHAEYSETDDIVCASVSSIMYTTVNAIMRFDKDSIKYTDEDDVVTITNIKHDYLTDELLLNMMSLFKGLVKEYPNNIKVESEEI